MTATQPQSGRPRKKMKEQGQWMLRRTVSRGRQVYAQSLATDLQIGLQISSRTVRRELHGMGFHGWAAASKPYITKCNAKRQMQWCKASRHWTASPSGNLMVEFGFGGCQENGTCLIALCQVKTMVEGGLWCRVVFQELGLAHELQWKELWMIQHAKIFWTISCSQLCGNSLGMAPSCSNMTVHQCTKQGS